MAESWFDSTFNPNLLGGSTGMGWYAGPTSQTYDPYMPNANILQRQPQNRVANRNGLNPFGTNVGMPSSEPLANYSQPAGNFATPVSSVNNTAYQAPAFNAPPAPPPIINPNPGQIGSDIAQYYTSAMANDPRMAPIMSNLAGQVPSDVLARLEQTGAERGVGIGSYGGGNDQTAMLRALGLTSLDLKDKGVAQYGDFYNSVPKLSPDSLFVSPTEQAKMNLQRELTTSEQKASWDRLQSQIAATANLSDKDRSAALHLAQLGFQNKAYLQDQELAAAKQQYEYLAKNQYNMSQNSINAAWNTFLIENQTRRDLGFAGLESQNYQANANRAQEDYAFGINRADTLSGVAATAAKLDQIFNRNNAWANGAGTPATGASARSGVGYDYSGLDMPYGTPDVPYGGFARDFSIG